MLIGSDIFLSNFWGPKVFSLNSNGDMVLFSTVVELSKEIKFELKRSLLLFANFSVDPLTLLTK